MSIVSAEEIKTFIASHLDASFKENNIPVDALPDDLDLMKKGIIDSIGLIMLLSAIEEHFNLEEVDFESMDTEDLTVIGPLCRYFEERARKKAT